MRSKKDGRIYLDYAAATPLDPRVKEVFLPYMQEKFGNPGSLHSFGQEALTAVDNAREIVAKAVGAGFREIIFTSSATEANNLALRGVIKSYISGNQPKISANQRPRIIVSAIEHESVLNTAQDLEREGVEVIYIPVGSEGFIDVKELEKALNEQTVLVSVMHANNVIGTIQPIAEISKIIRNFKNSNSNYPLFHTDAAQSFQYLDCDINKLGVDLLTLSGHKMCGPKGVGGLYIRRPDNLKPIITGGEL